MSPCVGSCNSRWRKAQEAFKEAQAEYDRDMLAWLEDPSKREPKPPPVPDITPWQGELVWCSRCKNRIGFCLAELDGLACRRLTGADGHRGQPEGQRVSGSRASHSPSPAVDDVDELQSMLEGWEQEFRRVMGWGSGARRGNLARRVTEIIDWLHSHLGDVLLAPFAKEFGEEVLQWHREFKAKTKTGTGRNSSPMPCSRCRERSLEWEDGAEYVECANKEHCGRLMSRDEYQAEYELWQAQREALRKAGQPEEIPAALL